MLLVHSKVTEEEGMSNTREYPMRAARMLIVLTAVGVGQALAVGPVGAQTRGGGMRMPRYDVATVVTVSGEVIAVDKRSGRAGMTGVHLSIKTASGTESVHLGPEAFIDGKGITVAVGDKVEVVGSQVTVASAPVVLARDFKRGATTVALRDSAGFPMWAVQGMRRRVP